MFISQNIVNNIKEWMSTKSFTQSLKNKLYQIIFSFKSVSTRKW